VTGGANDSSWSDKLRDFYIANFLTDGKPWAVTDPAYCPNSQSVLDSLSATAPNGQTVNHNITANLQNVVTVAKTESPGVRVLNVNYPYVIDQANVCASAIRSVIDNQCTFVR